MKRKIVSVVLLIVGLLMVRLTLGGADHAAATTDVGAVPTSVAKFTCSMHPQIILDHADLCPLCGMDLTPVRSDGGGWEDDDPGVRLVLSEAARKMADVGSVEIRHRELFQEIHTVGKVALDDTRVADVAARISGPIHSINADSIGATFQQGDVLVSIFSTEIYPAQQKFLLTNNQEEIAKTLSPKMSPETQNKLYIPRRRLEFFGMTDEQIDKLSRAAEGSDYLEVCAPISGTIIDKRVRLGRFVEEGEILYTIADLSHVWLLVEIYEADIARLRLGQAVDITLEGEPHLPATGKVGFIDPVLDDATRTVRVRVFLENQAGRFKPGMYAQATLRIPVLSDGSAASVDVDCQYACPRHPHQVVSHPSVCDQCGVPLKQTSSRPSGDLRRSDSLVLALPAEAVLTTGRRQLTYVEVEPGMYRVVEPQLGPKAGDYYPVLSGLKEGDRVVTRGAFLIDSQFQISGKFSLLHPGNAALVIAPEGFTTKEWANFAQLPEGDREAAIAQRDCPGCGMNLGAMNMPFKLEIEGRAIFLCCPGCAQAVKDKAVKDKAVKDKAVKDESSDAESAK